MIIDRPANRPLDQYPRNGAKRAIGYMQGLGIADEMIVGPEYEFLYLRPGILHHPASTCQLLHLRTAGRMGAQKTTDIRSPEKGDITPAFPWMSHRTCETVSVSLMEEWGVRVKYHHPEVGGCGQMEIEVELGEMTQMAEQHHGREVHYQKCRRSRRTHRHLSAQASGRGGRQRNACAYAYSKKGKPIFYDETGYAQLSQTALWFIGGMLEHAASPVPSPIPPPIPIRDWSPALKRPSPSGTPWPIAVLSFGSRYAKAPKNKRFELREPGRHLQPLLRFAAILMAGLDGIQNRIDPHERGVGAYDFNPYTLSDQEKAQIDSLPGKSLGGLGCTGGRSRLPT